MIKMDRTIETQRHKFLNSTRLVSVILTHSKKKQKKKTEIQHTPPQIECKLFRNKQNPTKQRKFS